MKIKKENWFKNNPKKTLLFTTILLLITVEIFSFIVLKTWSYYKIATDFQLPYQKFDMHTFYNYKPNTNAVFDDWKGVEKRKIKWKFDEFGMVYTPNDQNIKKLPEKKVVLFGGSTVFGVGSSDLSKTIASNLHKFLNNNNSKYFFRVYNAGVRGYFSYQEFNRYLNDVRSQIEPDIVINLNGRNDIFAATQGRNRINYDTNYTREIENHIEENKIEKISLFSNTMNLYKRVCCGPKTHPIRKFVSGLFNKINKRQKVKNPEVSEKDLQKVLNNYVVMMDTFRHLVEKDKKEFYWFLQPVAHYKKNLTTEEKKILEEWNQQKVDYEDYEKKVKYSYDYLRDLRGVNFIDLSDVFINTNETIYIDDCHYNDEGNKIIAKQISEIILSN